MSGLSDTMQAGVLNHVFCADLVDTALDRPSFLYLALHSTDPTGVGLALTEYLGGSYVRQIIAFDLADDDEVGNYVANRSPLLFADLPAANITYFAIWDALSGGSMISSGPVIAVNGSAATFIATGSGDTLTIAAGALRMYL